ncbi:threonine--tRNA ligase [Anaerofustis stercorihominis]|uniref:Threonine--tRNA ligase n=1 Tax=Anaerofustis stercorihominis DSM 17244 TaxID=445971 RepID=B1C884_9FIRM|nr:threonine--tRNA ligase [Anaerofustis stercorihominis]EDS73221.1 threonine--tRNA ligase [Anaerofustis stercorihominis DSM 17244]MCQ4794519.1 threonine--tRNA ligase [Anaerofustis stercorihominis]
MIKVTFPDGNIKEFENGVSVLDIAESISPALKRDVLCAKVNDEIVDIRTTLDKDASIVFYKFDDLEGKKAFWHTTSHILAQAVKRLYGDKVKLAIGPSIDNGFYYDFDIETPITENDLEKIEAEMKKIVKENLSIEKFVLPRKEAIGFEKEANEDYKVELIEDLPEDSIISFYKQGEFTDLCAGPHLLNTKPVKAIKLLSTTGAYWRGDSNKKMLQRVYGISFPKAKLLEEYLAMLEEAKKRDHRKIGKDMDLFMICEEGPGFPFFLPKGMVIRNELENFWREEHRKRGYQEIKTPLILNEQLWHTSGHWDHYKDNMYFTRIDDNDYAIKPMNCPGSMLVYKRKMWSYRDLPLRIGEMGQVHRHELSGALHGLMRVRTFTQDDAHIFMLPEQIKEEVIGVIDFIDYVYNMFGFKYHVELSTRPDDSMGSDEDWNMATEALREAMEEKGMDYVVNEGDGAFYGPKLDFHLEDCLGRTWQCGTIQLDFQMPQRFDLTYIGHDGEKHRPVMIHRVIFGSIERFIGILTEHFAGAFPLWLAPVQAKLIPITDRNLEYVKGIKDKLEQKGIRCEIDDRSEKMGYKIREAQLEKVPYMIIAGDRDMENGVISVRARKDGEDLGAMSVDEFINKAVKEIEEKSI